MTPRPPTHLRAGAAWCAAARRQSAWPRTQGAAPANGSGGQIELRALQHKCMHVSAQMHAHRAAAAHPQTRQGQQPLSYCGTCLPLSQVGVQQVLQAAMRPKGRHQHAAALAQQQGGRICEPLPHRRVGRQPPCQRLADVPEQGRGMPGTGQRAGLTRHVLCNPPVLTQPGHN